MRLVATLVVIGHDVAAMLVLVDAGKVDTGERIGQDAGIGEIRMDDDHCEERKWYAPACM